MPTPGPWRDDSVPFWTEVGITSTANYGHTTWSSEAEVASGGWAAAGAIAWAGTGTLAGPTTDPNFPDMLFQGFDPAGIAYWRQQWVTCSRYLDEVTEGVLPASVHNGSSFVDPNVIGVEWEPTGATLQERMTVSVGASGQQVAVTAGLDITVKTRVGTSFLTAGQVAALDTLAVMTPASSADRPAAVFTPPASSAVTLSLFDEWTLAQNAPADPGGGSAEQAFPFTVLWEGEFAPRFRLLYADELPGYIATRRRRGAIRQLQRGDAHGMSTASRALQHNSTQGSLRNIGFD